jgi:hypothetical protein
MTEVVKVPFKGDELLTIEVDGRPHVILKPAFEAIGLDAKTQIDKLAGKSWACTGLVPVQLGDQRRTMVIADVRTFLMALATVDERRVSEAARPKLVAYQAEVADAIESYWTKGGALNPRASADELERLRLRAAVLQALQGFVDPGFLDAKGRILAAQALGETPELDQATKPLTVSIYLSRKGLKGKEAKAVAPMFGKRLKAAYVEAYSEQPPSVEDVVGRHVVPVAQYQEQHSHLFDRIWAKYYGGAA